MDRLNALVEQHVKESELRLKHVDEMVERARQSTAAGRIDDQLLARIEADRSALRAALENLKGRPPGDHALAVEHGRGLRAALEKVGLELEKALAAVAGNRG